MSLMGFFMNYRAILVHYRLSLWLTKEFELKTKVFFHSFLIWDLTLSLLTLVSSHCFLMCFYFVIFSHLRED